MNLSDKTLSLYAAKHYTNTQCYDMDEFNQDLQIASHIKKLLTRYRDSGILRERLILNHFISFFNVFEPEAATKILFFKMEEEYYTFLKTVLVYLNREPVFVKLDDNNIVHMDAIQIDTRMLILLEEI